MLLWVSVILGSLTVFLKMPFRLFSKLFPYIIYYKHKYKCKCRSESHSGNMLCSSELQFVYIAWKSVVCEKQVYTCTAFAVTLFNVAALRNSLFKQLRGSCRHLWDDMLDRVTAGCGKPHLSNSSSTCEFLLPWLNEKTFH